VVGKVSASFSLSFKERWTESRDIRRRKKSNEKPLRDGEWVAKAAQREGEDGALSWSNPLWQNGVKTNTVNVKGRKGEWVSRGTHRFLPVFP